MPKKKIKSIVLPLKGRPYREALEKAAEIDKTLQCGDRRFRNAVFVKSEWGEVTTMFFENAFLMRWNTYIFIFTEHHRFHVYDKEDVTVKEFKPHWGRIPRAK